MAIAGLILSIFSFFGGGINMVNIIDAIDSLSYYNADYIVEDVIGFIVFGFILFISSILGIIFSAVGIARGPKGCAIPGLILSILSMVFIFIFMIACASVMYAF